MFECKFCNYTTSIKSNMTIHEKSIKHINNIKKGEFICFCKKQFKTNRGLHLHQKKYKCANDINELVPHMNNNQNLGRFDQIKEHLQGVSRSDQDKIKQIIDNDPVISGNNNSPVVIINNNNNNYNNNNTQLITQVNKLYPNAPILKKLDNYQYLDSGSSKEFMDDLIYYHKRGNLHIFFGDFILKHYKKKDLSQQSIYNTDVARLNFIIRILADSELLWKKDWRGIKTQKIIIIPMLTYTEELITDYIKKYSRRNFVEKVNMRMYTQVMDKIAILMQIEQLISSKKLEKNVLKYIAPFFKMDNEEKGEEEYVETIVETIEEKNKIGCDDFLSLEISESSTDSGYRRLKPPKVKIRKSDKGWDDYDKLMADRGKYNFEESPDSYESQDSYDSNLSKEDIIKKINELAEDTDKKELCKLLQSMRKR